MLSFKNQKIKWHFLAGVLILVSVLLPLSEILAVRYEGIGGKPAYPDIDNPKTSSIFIYTLNPGETKEDGVLVINNTQEAKTLMIYSADSTPPTGGAFACRQMKEEKKDAGKWIKLEKSEVTLEPIKSEIIPFTVTVPQDTESGEYNGCICIQEKKPSKEQEGGIRIATRMAIRVAVTVPGEFVKKLVISDFKISPNPTGGYFTTPYLKNEGNVSIDADVQLITRYIFGLKLKEINSPRTIFRGETGSWNYELEQPFLGGWYRTSLTVNYEGTNGKEILKGPTITFFSKPTKTGQIIDLCIFSILLVAIFLFWLSKRRKKWIKKDWIKYEIQPGDNLKSLAEKFEVSWKILAKVNKLKPPYELKIDEKIKVPPKSQTKT